jgi:hypothetical protein
VRVIAAGDHFLEMTILCLDDRVGRVSLQPMLTRPTQLLARHCLHSLTALFAGIALWVSSTTALSN